MIAPEQLQGLLEVAHKEAGDKQEGAFSSAVLDLLVACASSAPPLFAGLSEQVHRTACVGIYQYVFQ